MWATWANLGPRQGQNCAQIGPTSANNNNYNNNKKQGRQRQPQQQQQQPQPRAKTGANLCPNTTTTTTTTTTTPARADGSAFAGARLSGVSLINPARGPLAVSLPYGSSLLSVGEGPRPLPPTHSPPPKYPAFYRVFCSSVFSAFFGACGSRWVNIGLKMGEHSPKMGQHSPQDGTT